MCAQCIDATLTNVVPKDQLTSYKLGGATECHAPELALELRNAKSEAGGRVACGLTALASTNRSHWGHTLGPPRPMSVRASLLYLQKRPARLCFAKQSSYELGTLAYRIVTGAAVVRSTHLPAISDLYPQRLRAMFPQLVATDPGTYRSVSWGMVCSCFSAFCM